MASNEQLYDAGAGKKLLEGHQEFDIFISAFNLSDRVRHTFDKVAAKDKYWIIHNEYKFGEQELPTDARRLTSNSSSEADFIIDTFGSIQSLDPSLRIAVDITGFMRPHLMFMMYYLRERGINKFALIYTEPSQYKRKSETIFSSDVLEVRQINGYEGLHTIDMTGDVLIVGVGYDHDLISHVLASKGNARQVQLLSLPSLSADMYQESLIRLHKVSDNSTSLPEDQLAYASANDPFATYIVLGETLERLYGHYEVISNLYLSPLATKPQAVGFAMFYLSHLVGKSASIMFPFASSYSKDTSKGVGRAWLYEMNFSQ